MMIQFYLEMHLVGWTDDEPEGFGAVCLVCQFHIYNC